MLAAEPKCPACGNVIPANAPEGQCIHCALRLLLERNEPDAPSATPIRFAGYELLQKIGEGGMGVVWKARQLKANRLVALKMIKSGLFASDGEVARFRAEAEAAASLDHPGIVPIYEVGDFDRQLYYSMKLIEGGPLSDRIAHLRSDQISNSEAASVLARISRSVHYAHQRGIIHRDLKPSNILLTAQREPLISDFGVAKRLDAPSAIGERQLPIDLTLTGNIIGAPAYIAPEQAAAKVKHVTTASDIYSLGVILYQLLTGRLPLSGETPLETLRLVVECEPVRPRAIQPNVNRDLEIICLKCLAKDPARRYASAERLADDLERWLRHEPISARPPTPWERAVNSVRRHPVRVALLALVLLAALLTGTYFYTSHRTYLWLMGKIVDEHLIIPPTEDGTYLLHIDKFKGARCTWNFWRFPFIWYPSGRYGRIEFTNIRTELANTLQVQLWSDIPAYPDIPRTPALTNGQVFFIRGAQRQERAFYFAPVNFNSTNLIEQAPEAAIRVILLGHPEDPDPYKPAGHLTRDERE